MKTLMVWVAACLASLVAVAALSWVIFSPDALDVLGSKKATHLAKVAHTLDEKNTNEREMQDDLAKARGEIQIHGWSASKVDKGVYLVVFRYEHNGAIKGYAFEVHTQIEVVRDVFESRALVAKYGFPVPPETSSNEVVQLVREQFPGDNRADGLLTLELGRWAQQNKPEWFEQYPDFFARYVDLHDSLSSSGGHRLVMPTPSQFVHEVTAIDDK